MSELILSVSGFDNELLSLALEMYLFIYAWGVSEILNLFSGIISESVLRIDIELLQLWWNISNSENGVNRVQIDEQKWSFVKIR